jgi:cellulose synthase/poly-beta-1,6-N-acetylglucosamine synthase-like glycosyltransferase
MRLRRQNDLANRHAGKLLLLGLAGVAAWNGRQWQKDKALLAARGEPEPLPPLEAWPALPRVSVLVAAWNEAAHIERHIESVLGLRYPQVEVVLCAGGADDTYELARRYAGDGVTVLEQRPGEGKQGALRRCLARASGEVVFLTDADCVLDDEAFERTLAPVVQEGLPASTGTLRPLDCQVSNSFVTYQWAADRYGSLRAPDDSPGLQGGNCAIQTRVLEKVAAFGGTAATGTDYVLARQLLQHGYSIRTVRSSAVQTEYPTTARAYLSQRSRWLRNLITIGLQSGDAAQTRRGLQSAAIAVSFLLMPLFGLMLGRATFAVWLTMLAHAVSSRIRYVGLLDTPTDLNRLKAVLTGLLCLGLDLVAWSGALVQSMVPAWRSRWD